MAGALSREAILRRGCTVRTFDRVLTWFNQHWPGDLEWPRDIPRPPKSKKEAA